MTLIRKKIRNKIFVLYDQIIHSCNLFALDKISGVIRGSALLWQKAAYWSLPRLGNETRPVTQKTQLWNKPKAGWRWVNSLNIRFNLKVKASVQLYLSLTKTLWGGVLQIFYGEVLEIFSVAFIRWNHRSLCPMTSSVLVSCWKGESLKYIFLDALASLDLKLKVGD